MVSLHSRYGNNKAPVLNMQRGTLRIQSGCWYGQWNTYFIDATTGEKKRRSKVVKLGPKSIGKKEAAEELFKHIQREAEGKPDDTATPDSQVTLKWFTENRWLPMKESGWRPGTKETAEYELGLIYGAFGGVAIEDLDKVALQTWLNRLAGKKSDTVVKHCKIKLKSILEEAVEQDYLRKNPARSLALPRTRAVDKTVLTPEQFQAMLKLLDEKRSLMLRLFLVCALRPSEFFALRWSSFDTKAKVFHLRESIYHNEIRPYTKTTEEGDRAHRVAVPDVLVEELQEYRKELKRVPHQGKDQDFIFPTNRGTFISKDNFLNRVMKDLREKLNLPKLNFQILRRSAATWAQNLGNVKDVQTHLRHSSPDVTFSEYVQAIPESTRSMVNAVYDTIKEKDEQE